MLLNDPQGLRAACKENLHYGITVAIRKASDGLCLRFKKHDATGQVYYIDQTFSLEELKLFSMRPSVEAQVMKGLFDQVNERFEFCLDDRVAA